MELSVAVVFSVYKRPIRPFPGPIFFRDEALAADGMAAGPAMPAPPPPLASPGAPAADSAGQPPRVRTDFPETWLWESLDVEK